MDQASQRDKYRNRADSFLAPAYSDEEVKEIIQLYNDSNSMGVIAAKYAGRTRSGIAGLIHRERKKNNLLENKAAPIIPKKPRGRSAPQVTRPNGTIASQPEIHFKSQPKQKRVRLKLVESPTAVTFAELDKHHCKFPLGDPKLSDFRFCGGQRLPGKPYCAACTEIAETPARVYNRIAPNRPFMLTSKAAS